MAAVLLALLLTVLTSIGSGAMASAAPSTVMQAAQPPLDLVVRSVEPPVAAPGQQVTIAVEVRNTGTSPIPEGTVDLVLGPGRVGSADEITAWATGTGPATGRVMATAGHGVLPAASSTLLGLVVPDLRAQTRRAYDVLPVSVQSGGVARHTFLGFQSTKEYEQLSLAWLVPLTLDPDPNLWGAAGEGRTAAWQQVLADASRIGRTVAATRGKAVTLAVDAALLTDPSVPVATQGRAPTSSPSPSPSSVTPSGDPLTAEAEVRAASAERLRAALAGTAPVILPAGDPDLSAPLPDGIPTAEAIEDARRLAGDLGGRADIAWPVDPQADDDRLASYAARLGSAPGAVIVDRDHLAWRLDQSGAGRRSAQGVPLLAGSRHLADAATRAVRPETAAAGRQEFLAQSLALLDEAPGVARTALVAPARGFDPEPASFDALLASVARISWVAPTTVSAIVQQAGAADPVSMPAEATANVPPSPIDQGSLARIDALRSESTALDEIREDGGDNAADVEERLGALTSAAWRTNPDGFRSVLASVGQTVAVGREAIRVVPQTINFLADSGRVQVTVENALDVPVSGVRVRLVPGSPIVRVDGDTKVIDIGASARTTVIFEMTALAAGQVPLEAQVTSPSGQVVGPRTALMVRATPTGSTIYWVIGAVTAVMMALGLWRNRRAHQKARAENHDGDGNVVLLDESGQVLEQGHPGGRDD